MWGARLYILQQTGNTKAIAMLLNKGADAIVDAKSLLGETPLHHARSPQVVRLLVEAGANLESRDRWGRTAPYHSADRYSYHVMIMLRQNGADVNAFDFIGDSVPLEWQWTPRPPYAAIILHIVSWDKDLEIWVGTDGHIL